MKASLISVLALSAAAVAGAASALVTVAQG